MQNNDTDKFESKNQSLKTKNENFFISEQFSNFENFYAPISEPTRRLNDYDNELLQEDAYKDIEDELFKLEYKMSKIEKELESINTQITSAEEIQDYLLLKNLLTRRNSLLNEQIILSKVYTEKSLSAKISGSIFNLIGKNLKKFFATIKNRFSKISGIFVRKMPKYIKTIIELKKSLNTLETLNKSVNELVGLNIPYGENYNKYEQLSKYIIKANSIQSEISKQIKNK